MTIPANRLQLDQAAQTLADLIQDPDIQERASTQQMDQLYSYWEAVTDARDLPPTMCVLCDALTGRPGSGSCLDLLDAEPGILRDQCLTGSLGPGSPLSCVARTHEGTATTCADWWAGVSIMLGNAAALADDLGRPAQAEILDSTREGTQTTIEQSHASREFEWPEWVKENQGWFWLLGIALAFRLSGVGQTVTVQRRSPARRKPRKRKAA